MDEVRKVVSKVESKKPWEITPTMPDQDYMVKWHGSVGKYWWDRYKVFLEQELE